VNLPLFYYGHPILRKKCEPILEITDEIRQLAANMNETVDRRNAVGFAAPQVGKSIRMFVLRRYIFLPDGRWTVSEPYVYINPKILEVSEETWVDEEGCMSIPGLRVPVERPLRIKVEGTDLDGNTFVHELEGLNARVVLHENDHLNGVLSIDRTDPKTRQAIEPKLRAIKKKYNF